MNTIPAREIKRCGIGVVDELLERGPVHVIKNDKPRYVILDEAFYEDLVEDAREGQIARIRESRENIKAGRVRTVHPETLLHDLGLDTDVPRTDD